MSRKKFGYAILDKNFVYNTQPFIQNHYLYDLTLYLKISQFRLDDWLENITKKIVFHFVVPFYYRTYPAS